MNKNENPGESLRNDRECVSELVNYVQGYAVAKGGRSFTHIVDGLKQYPDMHDLKPSQLWVLARYGSIPRIKDN